MKYKEELKRYTEQNRNRLNKLRTDSHELQKITDEVWEVVESNEFGDYITYFLQLGKALNWVYDYDTTNLNERQEDQVVILTPDRNYTFFFSPGFQDAIKYSTSEKNDRAILIEAFLDLMDDEGVPPDLAQDFVKRLQITTITDYDELDDDDIKNA